jgi:hypothetical protein
MLHQRVRPVDRCPTSSRSCFPSLRRNYTAPLDTVGETARQRSFRSVLGFRLSRARCYRPPVEVAAEMGREA